MSKQQGVFFEEDMNKFKFHPANRIISSPASQSSINNIIKSMLKDGLLFHPVIVTKNMTIIDGQRRITAAKVAKVGIYYIIDEKVEETDDSIFQAALMYNRYNREWAKGDYSHGYSVMGDQDYVILEDFRMEFPEFTLSDSLMFLQNSGYGRINKTEFAEGNFEVKDLFLAKQWARNIIKLKPYYDGYTRSQFIRAMLTIFEKKPLFNFDEFIYKLEQQPGKLKHCGNKREYTEIIEEIYNFRRRESDRIGLRML